MHSTTLKIVLTGLLASAALSGCAPTTPRLDANFGDAVNTAKAQQIVNPDASLNTDPVAGLDGTAANSVIDRYNKSYEKPPAPANVFSIGVGTDAGAGTTR
jgi:type IV pilus biogenesis protein CpaD/CtpE